MSNRKLLFFIAAVAVATLTLVFISLDSEINKDDWETIGALFAGAGTVIAFYKMDDNGSDNE